jgi:hypothetical protein
MDGLTIPAFYSCPLHFRCVQAGEPFPTGTFTTTVNAGAEGAGAAFAVDADGLGQGLRSCGILLVVPGIFCNVHPGILLPCGIVPLAMSKKNWGGYCTFTPAAESGCKRGICPGQQM